MVIHKQSSCQPPGAKNTHSRRARPDCGLSAPPARHPAALRALSCALSRALLCAVAHSLTSGRVWYQRPVALNPPSPPPGGGRDGVRAAPAARQTPQRPTDDLGHVTRSAAPHRRPQTATAATSDGQRPAATPTATASSRNDSHNNGQHPAPSSDSQHSS